MNEPLLKIGNFARLAGLSEGALRHYDELGLLRPAVVDSTTGYRRYAREQLANAQTIARLRRLGLPLDEIMTIVTSTDPAERERLVARHRVRMEARAIRAERALHILSHTDVTEEIIVPTPPTADPLDSATHRAIGIALYNRSWDILELEDRTPTQNDELIHNAHASCFHWRQIEPYEPVRAARGEWMCARVYATLGRPEPALWHARRCYELVMALPLGEPADGGRADFDVAGACEALARAYAVAGDAAESERWAALGRAALEDIRNPEDRRYIELDLASLPPVQSAPRAS